MYFTLRTRFNAGTNKCEFAIGRQIAKLSTRKIKIEIKKLEQYVITADEAARTRRLEAISLIDQKRTPANFLRM